MLNNRDLDYFVMAAQILNLGIASQKLNITQPALSKSIARLEKELNLKLFDRQGRGLQLTEAGRLLLSRGLQLQQAREGIIGEMTALGQGEQGIVRIGSAGSVTQYLLPGVCQRLQHQAPGITLEIEIGMNDRLFRKLQDRELDMVIGPQVHYSQPVTFYPVTTDRVVVVTHRGHALAGKSVRLKALSDYGWILPAGSVSMRQWLDRVFREQHCRAPDVRIEISSLAAVPELIAQSGLLSFISENSLSEPAFAERLVRVDVSELVMERGVGITCLPDHWLSPATSKVIDVTCQYASEALPQPLDKIKG